MAALARRHVIDRKTVEDKVYLFVAIDRMSKACCSELHERTMQSTGASFFEATVEADLSRCYDEARQCYVFSKYVAAHATLRTALEVALQDLCRAEGFLKGGKRYAETEAYFRYLRERRGHTRRNSNFSDAEPDDYLLMPRDMHNLLEGVDRKYRSLVDESRELYHDLCSVVHGRSDPDKEETRVVASDVEGLLERFYDHHLL